VSILYSHISYACYGKTIYSPFKLNLFIVTADSKNGMNIKHKSNINIANEKIGIGMIAASLCVILLAVGVFFISKKMQTSM